MIRSRRPLVLAVLAAVLATSSIGSPARAEVVEENEALVMRIVFEDCLGYIRNGKTPFQGLHTGPASDEAAKTPHSMMRLHGTVIELLSPRYVASWGEAPDSRFCAVMTVYGIADPGKLGVRSEGFIARVTERAAQAGLTQGETSGVFSPIHSTRWAEPETGSDAGPKRPVSVSIMPTAATADESVMDAGLIVMGGPTLGKP